MISYIQKYKAITIVLVLGFIAAVAYSFYFKIEPYTDAEAYDSIAWSLVQGTGYTETTTSLPNSAIGRLGPGYEFFLAFWYFIFGHEVWLIWIIQSLMHVASGFLIYSIIKRLYNGERREVLACLGAAFYVFFIDVLEFPAMLMTETLYLFLVILGTYVSLYVWQKPTVQNVTGVSLIFSLAILVRPPVAIVMGVLFLFFLARKYYTYALIFVGVAILMLAPWTIRNYLVYKRFIVTSAILGYDVWVGNSPDAKFVGELVATKEIDEYSTQKGLFAANERGIREVANLALKNPWEFIKLQLVKTSIYFSAARPAAFWLHLRGTPQLLTVAFSSLFTYVLLVVGLSGAYIYARKKDDISRMLVLYALAAPAGIIWVVAETRYRYQIYPILIVLGVLFVAEFLKHKRILTKTLIIVGLVVSSNTILDITRNLPRVMERFQKILSLLSIHI